MLSGDCLPRCGEPVILPTGLLRRGGLIPAAAAQQRLREALLRLLDVVILPLAILTASFWLLGVYEQRQRLTVPTPGQQLPAVHAVAAGDDLRTLARQYYGDPRLWTEIWNANRENLRGKQGLEGVDRIVIPAPK